MIQKLEAFLLGLVALVALLVMDAYVEDFGGAQNGIVEVDPSPCEVRW